MFNLFFIIYFHINTYHFLRTYPRLIDVSSGWLLRHGTKYRTTSHKLTVVGKLAGLSGYVACHVHGLIGLRSFGTTYRHATSGWVYFDLFYQPWSGVKHAWYGQCLEIELPPPEDTGDRSLIAMMLIFQQFTVVTVGGYIVGQCSWNAPIARPPWTIWSD